MLDLADIINLIVYKWALKGIYPFQLVNIYKGYYRSHDLL
jgi:hypothetical protein